MTHHKSISLLVVLLICMLSGACGSDVSDENPSEGSSPGDCNDGADNDGDGDFDCNDSGCAGSMLCASNVDAGTSCSLMACGTSCVDTETDASNCGSCGRQCLDGFSCVLGECLGVLRIDVPSEESFSCLSVCAGFNSTISCSQSCSVVEHDGNDCSSDSRQLDLIPGGGDTGAVGHYCKDGTTCPDPTDADVRSNLLSCDADPFRFLGLGCRSEIAWLDCCCIEQ